MKIIKQLTFVIFSLVLLSAKCKKDNQAPQDELSKLPALTQTGANTFGCLVNGQAFVPKNQSILQGPNLQCYYQYVNGGYYFSVSCNNKNNDGSVTGVYIQTDSLSLTEGQIVKLTNYNTRNNASGQYAIFNSPSYIYYYYTNQVVTGELTITKFDQQKQILSGTFSFDAINTSNPADNVKITDGRFDMPYTQ